jgi:hypothetical protein
MLWVTVPGHHKINNLQAHPTLNLFHAGNACRRPQPPKSESQNRILCRDIALSVKLCAYSGIGFISV